MSLKETQEYLICPITLKLFNDPVLTDDGNTYEREAIVQWIIQHGTNPITKKPLRLNQLTPNNQIKTNVDTFKQTSRTDSGNNRQSLQDLDVLCLFCGQTQKFNNIKNHKLHCSSNPNKIEKFEIEDKEKSFTINSKNKSSRNGKVLSFENPLNRRTFTTTTTNNQISIQTTTQNNTNIKLSNTYRWLVLKRRQIKYLSIILFILILITIIIILTTLYIQCKQTHLTTELTSIFTSTSTLSSTSIPGILCPSAEWNPDGITVVSNLSYPYDIGIDSEDNLIIGDAESRHLEKYFVNGTFVTLFTGDRVLSVFIDKFDNIYFTTSLSDQVKKLNSNDGLIITVAGFGGSGNGLDQLQLDGQPGIYVDQNETLYISDTGNHRVMKYFLNSKSGLIVAGGHGQGPELNQLNTPYGIYVDEINEIGAIYICDKQNHRIQKWIQGSNQGITVATNNDQLNSPVSILLDSTTKQITMYISSYSLNQIFKWIPYQQQPQNILGGFNSNQTNQLFAQRGIKFDKYYNLFVADTGNRRILKFLFNNSSCQNKF